MTDFRPVIVHDRLTTPGGGERVVYHMSKILQADIITGEYDKPKTYDFSHTNVRELSGNDLSSFIMARNSINWSEYDIAIFSGNRPQFTVYKPLPIPSIRYCHSPVRTFWSLRDRDFRQASLKRKCARMLISPVFRQVDRHLTKNHDKIFTNSHNIRSQVDRFYGFESDVLFPPVDLDKYTYRTSGDFWLSVNRIVPKKRVQEQVNAFRGTDEHLKIVGGVDDLYQDYAANVIEDIDSLDNVSLEGFVSDEELRSLYSDCKGILYIPYFEDFGIVPVEAMASGKPVVAAAEGGPLEIVHDQFTGWTIQPTTKEIRNVIQRGFSPESFRERCMESSMKYSLETFEEKLWERISNFVESKPQAL